MKIYAGRRNGFIKAYTTSGKLLYSREMIEIPAIDFKNMEPNEIRSSPSAMLDFTVHQDHIFILVDGTGENRWRYLDVYDKNNGDYLHTFMLEHHTYRITSPPNKESAWFVLGFDVVTKDMILSAYYSPD